MTLADQTAKASAQFIRSARKQGCLSAVAVLALGASAIVYVTPNWPVAIGCIAILTVVLRIHRSKIQPHETVVQEFARTRNWFYEPQTELRHVNWQKRRVRFYCDAPLLSVGNIVQRLLANDFASRPPPPTGEVPRKQRASRPTGKANIPLAGWKTTSSGPVERTGMTTASATESSKVTTTTPLVNHDAAGAAERSKFQNPQVSGETVTTKPLDSSPKPEGARRRRAKYAVVRSAKLRNAAIAIHGRKCCVCGFSFDEAFGEELAKGYIEVHHLNQIASGVRNTDPATDLAPLCSNCHAMADRLARHHPSPPSTINELRKFLSH